MRRQAIVLGTAELDLNVGPTSFPSGNIIAMQNLDFTVRKKSNITLLTLNHFTQKRV